MRRASLIAVFLCCSGALSVGEGEEFFEKKIRPVLVDKCYACHSASAPTPMGGLRLDRRDLLLKGGDSGPAIVPGKPQESRLYKALTYTDLKLKMPPTGKLSDEQIADFRAWIEMGAPDPRDSSTALQGGKPTGIAGLKPGATWPFVPVRKIEPPRVKNLAWVRSPVDAFILHKIEQKGIGPAPPATRRDWLRRITFDLTGLPPTPEEIEAFLADESPRASEKVAEHLLASPHYGERWARHWLDLMRFAETNGHEFDNDKLDAWRYRDYVIRAFNQDVPYNQFVREHLAGDSMPGKRLTGDGAMWDSPVATGAFWFGEVLNSAVDSVKSRADQVDNQLDVFGKAFLGLTIACARCHDHKFDPIPTADYYSLAGIMHSTAMREAVVDSPGRAAEIASIHARIGEINSRISALLQEVVTGLRPVMTDRRSVTTIRPGDILFEDFETLQFEGWTASGEAFRGGPRHGIPPNQPIANYRGEGLASSFGAGSEALVGSLSSAKFRMPKLYVHVRMAGTKSDAARETTPIRFTVVADDYKSLHLIPKGTGKFQWYTARNTKEIGRICYFEIVDRSRAGHIAVDRIVLSDSPDPPDSPEPGESAGPAKLEDLAEKLPPAVQEEIRKLQAERAALEARLPESAFAMIAVDEAPRNVAVHIRGNHNNLGAETPRRFLRVVAGDGQPSITHGSGRLQLADWIAGENNPLTARVMVNRIWKHHFGRGLVATTDNFGKTGEPPTHPELLDYLAARFVESGWSVKAMHRLIVLSSTYRMSSRPSREAARLDPANKLLHHVPVRRLEAEVIRDAVLAVSGTLDPRLYGPSVPPHISKYQDGRGKPKPGPPDGNGRRSIYIQLRRNFLPPLFLVFDYPLPTSAAGARQVSTVPSQALLMMNNEFIAQAARRWAGNAMRAEADPARRLDRMFIAAFARAPEKAEREQILSFVNSNGAGEDAWAHAAHVLLNSAEFIYMR